MFYNGKCLFVQHFSLIKNAKTSDIEPFCNIKKITDIGVNRHNQP